MNQQTTVGVLKALADETRLGIVIKLSQAAEPVNSCDIVSSCASLLRISQPTMSHHFAKLVDAGVLKEVRRGTQKAYTLDTNLLASVGIDVKRIG